MSHYDWPLSPIYEFPLSSSSSSFEPIPEIPRSYKPTSLSISLSICKARSTVLALLRRQDDEPQVTTSPKHRMKRAKDLMTLRRVIPVLTILLIILTFSYLAVRREPGVDWRMYGYEKRYVVGFEGLGDMVPTGLVE
ncbi:hypothetical protein L486_03599 [Kwoniella mangroviensis CBS 10435]|uniref:Uncharacterized protein n=1 Tax=Kwoniella mangroviensis CBS 10435 TaxID=1331196 RepID=A0A1B9IU79_9TREE|nr:hypothetical protein L486_03599 [Kwoniella mangroviensis CBS 10435]